jgi:hypothetical protein
MHRCTRRLRTAVAHSQRDLKIDPTSLETGEPVGDSEWKFMLFALGHMPYDSKQWSPQKQMLLSACAGILWFLRNAPAH